LPEISSIRTSSSYQGWKTAREPIVVVVRGYPVLKASNLRIQKIFSINSTFSRTQVGAWDRKA